MLIPLLVFGVLLIALIFFLVKSSDTWNWVPITFVALIFLTSIFAGIAASRSLKVRNAWKSQYESNEVTLAKVQREFDEALYGPDDTVEGYGSGSLRERSTTLRLAQIGKGRIWEKGSPTRNQEQYTLSYTPEEGQPAPASQIRQDMQLYAFEASDRIQAPDGGSPPAADFVGIFKVASQDAGAGTITVDPIFLTKFYYTGSLMRQLSAELAASPDSDKARQLFIELEIELEGDLKTEFMNTWETALAASDMSSVSTWLDEKATAYEPVRAWTMFEKMPGDDRAAFLDHAGLEPFSNENPGTPENLARYRDLLASTYLPAEMMSLDPESGEYEELLDQFNFDGVKLNEITQFINQNSDTRVSDRFVMADDPENVLVTVLYNNSSEEFRVDGTGNPTNDGRFSVTGEAIDPDLHLGKDVVFPKDTEVVLPKIAAEDGLELQDQVRQPSIMERSDAELTGVEYFQRPLRDYPYQLREYRELTRKASSQRRDVEENIAVTEGIIEDARTQISNRDLITANLNEDIASMKLALDEITRLHDLRKAELEECQLQIQTYYNQIIEMYKELDQENQQLDTSIQRHQRGLVNSSR